MLIKYLINNTDRIDTHLQTRKADQSEILDPPEPKCDRLYSACDSGVDTLDDRIDTPPGDIEILAIVYPDLEDALKEYFEDVHDAIINNPECYQTQIDDSDLDDVIEKVDAVLEPMGEDLDHTNFMDRLLVDTEEEASIDWYRMDSVAVQELQDAREGLNDDYLANCPESEDFVEDAEELLEEYAEDISDMGQDKFVEWVSEFTIGGQETDNCIDKCLSDFASAVATATTLQVLGIEVCAAVGAALALVSPIGGAIVGAGCVLAVDALYDKSRDDAQDEASDCIMACLAAGKPYDNRGEKWH